MIANKNITRIVAALMAIAVALCFAAQLFSDQLAEALGGTGVTLEYESELFDTSSPIQINILISEDDWADLLANAIDEDYYTCDVEVNGTTFYEVGVRAKGNTSLSSVVNDPDSDRYSFKLEFDQYVEGQTCFGLDKLVLNNNYADATNMKEALVYDMFQTLGADASLYNYAVISVNGEYWGVYLALEAVEDSFMLRNYGAENGYLYKPEGVGGGGGMRDGGPDRAGDDMPDMVRRDDTTTDTATEGETPEMPDGSEATDSDAGAADGQGGPGGMGGGPGGGPGGRGGRGGPGGTPPDMTGEADSDSSSTAEMPQAPTDGEMPQMPDGEAPEMPDGEAGGRGGMGGGPGGGMGGSSGGADLNYVDDELDSYETIWDGEVNSSSKKDHKRVIAALKAAAEGEDLETYLDIDNILKYMAVHAFVMNDDSLSGSMAHNYYLYEANGQLNIIPWDYNLAFGGMNSNASSAINDPIDTPFEITQFFDAILENEEYLAQYHEYLRQLAEEYVLGGGFESFYARTRAVLDSLVESDPTAFYSYDEYTEAAEMLCQVVALRAESVLGQLDGTIPSTTDGQQQDSSALVDTSGIDLSVMGGMNNGAGGGSGGGPGGGPGGMGGPGGF